MRIAKVLATVGLLLVIVGIVSLSTASSELRGGWREIAQDKHNGLAVLPLLVGLPMLTFAFGRLAQLNRSSEPSARDRRPAAAAEQGPGHDRDA